MLKRYFFLAFAQIFFPFFLVLFFISSIILIITIAGSSFVIKITFLDLSYLFLYSLPNTVFFIIPITFFASCVLAISRLSYDYELLVFFSLGVRPFEIVKIFLPITLIVTLTSLVFSLGAVPISKRAFDNFVEQKKVDVDINIKAGEFGQKIGSWLVYVDRAENRIYKNLVLFSIDKAMSENFISASEGKITNDSGVFSLFLKQGNSYIVEEQEFKNIAFKEMYIRTQVGEAPLSAYDLFDYWKNAFNGESLGASRKFVKATLISLFPLVSIFLIPLIGIANPRYHKNFASFYILAACVLYYVFVHIFAGRAPFVALGVIPICWFCVTYFLYWKKIKPLY
ncbi:permease [Helicobacter enhydrae]|uniref:Permease n=1 Tax=Helicobacter enhydrae TaxID=222136 RepID=A0A1B1U3Q6_9HELI|nr:LptF/LptG family permease [Helicobacter enhydrae]ANV97386.1 permease [Helicobacter enhydrae]